MVRALYRFHVYFHVRRILKGLQVSLPHEAGFNAADNLCTNKEFFNICRDYEVPRDPMRYRDEKFYWTYQRGVGWPDDYIGPDSMIRWVIEKSQGFTNVGLLRISESVRAYTYLILSLQAFARSSIIGNTASALTAQKAFLNNFEDIINRRVDIREDIKHYQDTLSYASSKVNHSVGKNDKVNALVLEPVISKGAMPKLKSHMVVAQPTHAHELAHKPTITHEEEKIALILFLTGGFAMWFMFQ